MSLARHTPVKVFVDDSEVYGRVSCVEGGTVTVLTPGGSTIRSGLLWVRPLTTAEDRDVLQHWERVQKGCPYRGAFFEEGTFDPLYHGC